MIGHPKARDNGLPTTKKLFFTVITGNYDALRQPCVVSDGWEYVCFTDKAASGRHGVWQMVDVRDKLSRFPRDPKKRAAMISIRYFDFVDSAYDIVASADANLKLNPGIDEFCREHFDLSLHDLALCKHGDRDCAYEEAEECKRLGYDRAGIIDRQMNTYRREGYPEHHGLGMTGIMIRNGHSESLREFCRVWASQVIAHSKRVQLSLNYALWRSGCQVRLSNIDWNRTFIDRKEIEILMHSQSLRGQWTKLLRSWRSLANATKVKGTRYENTERRDPHRTQVV